MRLAAAKPATIGPVKTALPDRRLEPIIWTAACLLAVAHARQIWCQGIHVSQQAAANPTNGLANKVSLGSAGPPGAKASPIVTTLLLGVWYIAACAADPAAMTKPQGGQEVEEP